MLTSGYCSSSNPQLLPPRWNCQPLLSSKGLDWQNIQFDYFRHHPYVLPRHCYSQYLLKIFLSEGKIRRCLDEEERVERVFPGDVAIIPPNINHHASWQNEIEFILLSLQPGLLELPGNKINRTGAKILPQFATHDPLISGVGITLKTQLESDYASAYPWDRNSCSDYAHILGNAIAVHLFKKYSKPSAAVKDTEQKDTEQNTVEQKLQVVLEYIEQNLSEKLTLDSIAEQVNLSKYYLCRLFVKHLNISPRQHIIQKRIAKSKQLLKQNLSMQVVDIAYDCGFASHSHFNRQFNKNVGMSPKAYRNSELK